MLHILSCIFFMNRLNKTQSAISCLGKFCAFKMISTLLFAHVLFCFFYLCDDVFNSFTTIVLDPTNLESLALIESCVFVLCLDRAIPVSFNHQRSVDETNMNVRDDVSMLVQMLHGQGSNVNSCNRWFDKTMQVRYVGPCPILLRPVSTKARLV